jgi:hypothetical protein
MHTGDEVYITRTGKYYHYFDDDCPTTSRILKGNMNATKILETEAIEKGYTLCRHCAKEYEEDMAERKGCGVAAVIFLAVGVTSYFITSYV